jgi:HK97 gp10 family phage protein
MAKATIEGLDKLRKQLLERIPAAAKQAMQESLETSGREMVSTAKALAPVREGELRASITMTTAGEKTPLYSSGGRQAVGDLSVKVTAGDYLVRYAALVEYGTKKMAARPFFWPAYRSIKKRLRSRTSRAINSALKKALR